MVISYLSCTCKIERAAIYPLTSLLEYPYPLRSTMIMNFSSPFGILKESEFPKLVTIKKKKKGL